MKANGRSNPAIDLPGLALPKLSLEEAVTRVSRLFISNDAPDLNDVLQILSTTIRVSRAFIFMFRENGQWMDSSHAWPAMPGSFQGGQLQNINTSLFSWSMAQLHSQKALVIPDVNNLPAEAGVEQKLLQTYEIHALLAVPITSLQRAEPLGFISFVETCHPREWSGKEIGLLQVVADMVSSYIARKRAEEGTSQAVRRYRALFEAAPVMYLVTRKGEKGAHVVNCNGAFLQAMGYSRAEVLGRQLAAFYTPDSRAKLLSRNSRPVAEESIRECQLLTRTGQVIETLLQTTPEVDINGQVFGTRELYIDITERKRAEAEIARLYQAEQTRYREVEALHQAALTLVSTLDLNHVIERLLIELQHVIPYDSASVQLLRANQMEIIGGRGFPNLPEILGFAYSIEGDTPNARVVNSRGPILIDDVQVSYPSHFNQGPHATAKVKAWLGVPLLIGEKVIGMLTLDKQQPNFYTPNHAELARAYAAQAAIAIENADLYRELDQRVTENAHLYRQAQQEISERKLVEAALEAERASLAQRVAERTAELSAANAELAQASRLKDEFLASMSHELRTPLNAILGLSEGLQEQVYGPLNEKQMKYLQTIEDSGRHLLALINDILDLSKIGAGKLTLGIEPVLIRQVCQASLRMINQNAQAKQLQVQFESELDPAALITADERRLKQILVNLLSNAVKFTPARGMIGLKVQEDTPRETVLFTVWDTGIGIAPEALPRLFKPFVQLDSSLARRYEGTGLGLSLVSRLTEMHGGHVDVQSQPGEGSQFTVSLPWLQPGQNTVGAT